MLSTALAKSPSDRFASCGQFAKAFREHVGAESVGEHPTQAGVTVASPFVLKPKADTSATSRARFGLRNALLAIVALVRWEIAAAAMLFRAYRGRVNFHSHSPRYPGARPRYSGACAGATSSCNRSSSCDAADVHGDRALTTVTTADAGT